MVLACRPRSHWSRSIASAALLTLAVGGLAAASRPAAADGLRFDFNLGWEDPPPARYHHSGRQLEPMGPPAWDDMGDSPDTELYADLPRRRAGAHRVVRPLPPVLVPRWGNDGTDDRELVMVDPDQIDPNDESETTDAFDQRMARQQSGQPFGGYPDLRSNDESARGGIQSEPLPDAGPQKYGPPPYPPLRKTLPPPAKIVQAPAPRNPVPSNTAALNKPLPAPLPGPLPGVGNSTLQTNRATDPKTTTVAKAPSPVPLNTPIPQPAVKPPAKPQQLAAKTPAIVPAPVPQPPVASTPPAVEPPVAANPNAAPAIPRATKNCPKGDEIERRLVADGWSGFAEPEKRTGTVLMSAKRDGSSYRLTLDRCTGVVLSAKLLDGKQAKQ